MAQPALVANIYDQLLKDRIIWLGSEVRDENANEICAKILLLAAEEFADLDLDACFGSDRITVVRRHARLTGAPGERLTLLAVGGPATGITTTGLRWALTDGTLAPGSSRGVSNEFTGDAAEITLTAGVLLAIAPDPRST